MSDHEEEVAPKTDQDEEEENRMKEEEDDESKESDKEVDSPKERIKRERAEENGGADGREDIEDQTTGPEGQSDGDQHRDIKKARTEGDGKIVIKLRGLPWGATEQDVKDFLSGLDIVEDSITVVENGSYESYVTLASEEDEKVALKKHSDRIGRRFIEVSKSSEAEIGSRKSGSSEPGVLRLRGLPYSSTESEVQDFFAGYGLAESKPVHFISDPSGRASGQAYVVFRTEDEARFAQRLDKEKIGDRWVDIFMSSNSEFNATINRGSGGGDSRRVGGGGYQQQRPMGGHSAGGMTDLSSLAHVVKVRGLPFDCTRSDLLFFFRDSDPKESGVFFVNRMDGKASGEAFVVFNSAEGVRKAMLLDKQKMRDRWLDIFESNTGDLLSRVGMAVSLSNKVDGSYAGVLKMRGLPFQAAVSEIQDFFSGYGVVPNGIYITNGPDGRVTGEAYVLFNSEGEAERARESLNKKSIMNRWIELIQVTKGDLYTATVSSPVINSFGGCPVYANVPMTCVRLKNLPGEVKEDDLFRFFEGLNVIGLYICRDHSGRATGEAYAEFGSLDDCQQAMSRNRDRLNASDRMSVEVHAVSKEDVLEMIEAEKRGEVGYMGAGGYRGGAAAGGWGGPPPGGYAAMARGGHSYGGGGGRGGGGGYWQPPMHHGGGGGYADRLGPRYDGGYGGGGRRDDRRW